MFCSPVDSRSHTFVRKALAVRENVPDEPLSAARTKSSAALATTGADGGENAGAMKPLPRRKATPASRRRPRARPAFHAPTPEPSAAAPEESSLASPIIRQQLMRELLGTMSAVSPEEQRGAGAPASFLSPAAELHFRGGVIDVDAIVGGAACDDDDDEEDDGQKHFALLRRMAMASADPVSASLLSEVRAEAEKEIEHETRQQALEAGADSSAASPLHAALLVLAFFVFAALVATGRAGPLPDAPLLA